MIQTLLWDNFLENFLELIAKLKNYKKAGNQFDDFPLFLFLCAGMFNRPCPISCVLCA